MYPYIQAKSTEDLKIYAVISYGLSSNTYIIESHGETAIIDVGYGPPHSNIIETLGELKMSTEDVRKVLITHRHRDHTRDIKRLLEENDNMKIYIHRNDRDIVMENLKIGKDRIYTLYGDENVNVGKAKIKVIHTPGHTSGSICFQCSEIIFTGDLVFANGEYGRTDLPTGNHKELIKSLERILTLNINAMLPGHGEIIFKEARSHIKLALKNAMRKQATKHDNN
ncbi:MAG: MBL fold metallo-hydrolase [archaeon GBS-70-058]|nr:MBL fold metallo-hydrolase [Candidatus Culexarchaeum nevadense]